MENIRKIYCSDFDGTLTVTDSMMRIIVWQRGWLGLVLALLRVSPWIVLMMMGRYSNQLTKERLLGNCFGGMSEEEFADFARRFAREHRHILRTDLHERLIRAKAEGHDVYVVTASPRLWVQPFVPEFRVIGTELEFLPGKGYTGRFLTPNCYGQEKVNRLLAEVPGLVEYRSDYHITAFGDSRGDRELLAFADEATKIEN